MQLQIEQPYVDAMMAQFPELSSLAEQLRFGNKALVSIEQLDRTSLAYLQNLYENAGSSMQARAAQIGTLKTALNDEGERYGADDLEKLVAGIADFLINGAIRGWLFHANMAGRPMPYLVTRLDYTPPGEEEAGRIFIEIKANSMGKLVNDTITIRGRDLNNKTVSELFAAKGYLKETVELITAYDEDVERYFDWRSHYGSQFSGRGTGFFAEDPSASHRSTDWSRKSVVVLSSSGGWARLVNDEGILGDRTLTLDATGNFLDKYLRKAGKSMNYDDKIEAKVEASREHIEKGMFTQLPVHGFVFMYHLDLHHHLWVHVNDFKPYAYKPELKQKLVLPESQTDLIDILTAEMDVLMDDIVDGKSGGTTVLCAGPPGVGKTLTAEVYSEIIKRPLYRVHSGQLGLNVGEMEKALKDVLTRAQRWGAVMLIDEADVYIKRRDNNMEMNAVVGVFLRVLEYFNGLLFLTTNRIDDIDEAIISRCIAMIKYHAPLGEDRNRIWQVMTEQFGFEVDGATIQQLVDTFPGATGRDIKGLAKLVAKYCSQKQEPPTLEVFKRCSIFRGMDF
jgi:hypothetical protein